MLINLMFAFAVVFERSGAFFSPKITCILKNCLMDKLRLGITPVGGTHRRIPLNGLVGTR